MTKCHKCKQENEQEAKYCAYCGTRLFGSSKIMQIFEDIADLIKQRMEEKKL